MARLDMTRDQAERRTILRALVGSTVHGLNVRDAVEDRDEMGVLVEPFEAVVGFTRFEQFIYRSAAERERPTGRPFRGRRPGPRDLLAADEPAAVSHWQPDDDAAALRPSRGRPRLHAPGRGTAGAGAPDRQPPRRACLPGLPAVTEAAPARHPAARCGCAARSWSRGMATTRNTRCTCAASATRVSSSCRPMIVAEPARRAQPSQRPSASAAQTRR